jgi:uncharacterized protein
MRSRPRDFLYSKDDLFFATTSYFHPKDRIISFLRYIPDPKGERLKNYKRYSKVNSKQAYNFLGKNFPDYLFDSHESNLKMVGVPLTKLKNIMRPQIRLKKIMDKLSDDKLLLKVVRVADVFNEHAGIPYDKMGISGSILPGLHDPENSDIDFVIYGLKNHRKALLTFSEIKDKGIFESIKDENWVKLYKKRIKDSSLSYEEFKWYEDRKNNRGVIDGTLFDILATRDWDEIIGKYGDRKFESLGTIKIQCKVSDAIAAFDNPAIYKVEDVDILEGPKININEIVSFTHTYAGQASEGEFIIAKGKLEKIIGKNINYRLVVGTTRESIGEYIKLKNIKGVY